MESRDPNYEWPPRRCEEVEVWLNARADGECSPAQEGWLASHLSDCQSCSLEWASLESTRLALETARFREPTDFERERLRKALAPRTLQVLGWAVFIAGAILVIGYAGWEFATAEDTPILVRLGIGGLGLGLLLLLGRVLWARLRELPYDPYRHVQR